MKCTLGTLREFNFILMLMHPYVMLPNKINVTTSRLTVFTDLELGDVYFNAWDSRVSFWP